MKKQRFWRVDLIVLFKQWGNEMSAFFLTVLMFLALSLPVVIPALVMWFLYSINWSASP